MFVAFLKNLWSPFSIAFRFREIDRLQTGDYFFFMMSYAKLKCWYVLVDWDNNIGNRLCFFKKHGFCHPCVTDAQNPSSGVKYCNHFSCREDRAKNRSQVTQAGNRNCSAPSQSSWCLWHQAQGFFLPRVWPPPQTPPYKHRVNQRGCNRVDYFRLTWGLSNRVCSQCEKSNTPQCLRHQNKRRRGTLQIAVHLWGFSLAPQRILPP